MMTTMVESSARPRVLVVDDNDVIVARASAVLAASCDVVGTAKDGRAALRAAKDLHPDVIVLDISMPELTGFEVAAQLRDLGSQAAVVFLTVHLDEDFVMAAQAVGGMGYVIKPRLSSDLAHAVSEARAGRSFVSKRR